VSRSVTCAGMTAHTVLVAQTRVAFSQVAAANAFFLSPTGRANCPVGGGLWQSYSGDYSS